MHNNAVSELSIKLHLLPTKWYIPSQKKHVTLLYIGA